MSRPKRIDYYPPQMLVAIDRAIALGEVVIPTENPRAMHLEFQGLRGALLAEGHTDRGNGFVVKINDKIEPKSLTLRARENSLIAREIEAALSLPSLDARTLTSEAEASFDRLLGG